MSKQYAFLKKFRNTFKGFSVGWVINDSNGVNVNILFQSCQREGSNSQHFFPRQRSNPKPGDPLRRWRSRRVGEEKIRRI